MNNLSEKQRNAKQAYLDNQQAQMLFTYQNTDQNERSAIIRQIDSFLSAISGDEKSFWFSFREKLERLSETNILAKFSDISQNMSKPITIEPRVF